MRDAMKAPGHGNFFLNLQSVETPMCPEKRQLGREESRCLNHGLQTEPVSPRYSPDLTRSLLSGSDGAMVGGVLAGANRRQGMGQAHVSWLSRDIRRHRPPSLYSHERVAIVQ